MELKSLPKITKEKAVLPLRQDFSRDPDFLDLFKETKQLYLFTILFHYQYSNALINNNIIISISELQSFYKVFKSHTKEELLFFVEDIESDLFENKIVGDNEITYKIKEEYFDFTKPYFYLNVSDLKRMKINSQKIALYLKSFGSHARFIRLSQIVDILGIDFKTQKQSQRLGKSIFDTFKKNGFVEDYKYDLKSKTFYFKLPKKEKKVEQDLFF